MTKLGRNDQCPCGSGVKYKKCCLPKHEAEAAERARLAAAPTAPPAADRVAFTQAVRSHLERWTFDNDDHLHEDSNRVVDLVHEGKLDEAEHAARDLLTHYPDVHDGFERLALVYEARGDHQQAAVYYRQALDFMRKHADNYDPEAIHWMREKAESLEHAP
jgi:tetratricopeptide (TPR) repeat protein